jgi:predicted nucleic acid-binding protein
VIVADTNIVSMFARIGALPLLKRLLEVDRLHITPGTYGELRKAIDAGCAFLEPVLASIASGGDLELAELTRQEILAVNDLPRSLGAGEAESIAVGLRRPKTPLLTNDKRARNFCRERGIACLDLPGILRAFWTRKVLSKKKVTKRKRDIVDFITRNVRQVYSTPHPSSGSGTRRGHCSGLERETWIAGVVTAILREGCSVAKKRLVFTEATPLGYRVVLPRDRWREIIRFKHPAMSGKEKAVQDCVRDPEIIRASAKELAVHIYYRGALRGYVCVVVGGDDPDRRFVVTAYFTKNIKRGHDLWKS